ncbi:MAG: VacJ family lipoprotein [Planctomycetes bacterium]|nr:VacJ family lipoprotein [Planctomycetota bacterium]
MQRNDWNAYTGPGAEHFRKQEYKLPYVPDPLEPSNRIVWAVNDFILFDLIEPVSAVWRFLIPQSVRTHLVNAAENITYPVRAVNNLLQGDFGKARDETHRFVINSTVGILGLFDIAAEWGIEPAPEELGQTFVKWGWSDSPYLVLPNAGPSTVRDALGLAGDVFMDPTTYYFPAGLVTRFVEGSEVIGHAKRIVRTNFDAYGSARYSWTATRWLNGMEFDEMEGDGPASETLDIAFLTYHDPWFPSRGRKRTVTIPSTRRKLPYDVWMQPGLAPIVYIVPGMGAHREARETIALAEMVYRRGFSAVTISSSMNFEFMEEAATVPVPGFAPADASDVHMALSAISRDLEERFPNRISAQVLMGMSLGAFHGLYIAAGSHRLDDSLVDFDRYVLLNPPVVLRYAAERLDAYYNTPLTFPVVRRDERVRAILHKAVQAVWDDSGTENKRILFPEKESQFLVGLSFRVVLHDAIWCSQKRNAMGLLKSRLDPLRRAPVSDEIFDFSFMEYFYAFVLPCCTEQDENIDTAQKMFKLMDARSLAGAFPTDGRVRVFSSTNDFLLTDADRQWLIHTFGESNVTIEATGGHTGSLHRPEVQRKIMASLEDLRPVRHDGGEDD